MSLSEDYAEAASLDLIGGIDDITEHCWIAAINKSNTIICDPDETLTVKELLCITNLNFMSLVESGDRRSVIEYINSNGLERHFREV